MTKAPTPDLASLMTFIGEGFPFTQEHYPHADLRNPSFTLAFAVSHSAKHMAKSTGKIAAESEEWDHGGIMNEEALKVATTKMLINALNLARMLEMTPEEIAARVPEVMVII